MVSTGEGGSVVCENAIAVSCWFSDLPKTNTENKLWVFFLRRFGLILSTL